MGYLAEINQQIQAYNITAKKGCHVDASITQSPRKPKTKPAYEMVSDREERDAEVETEKAMQVIKVAQPGVDAEARWVRKGGNSVFGYKQHTVVDNNGLVFARYGYNIQPGTRVHADKAYSSQKHCDALKSRGIKNGIQDKAAKHVGSMPKHYVTVV